MLNGVVKHDVCQTNDEYEECAKREFAKGRYTMYRPDDPERCYGEECRV